MVEILKIGTSPDDIIHRTTCGACSSLLSFKQSEAKITYDQRDGNYMKIICPVCSFNVTKHIKGYF